MSKLKVEIVADDVLVNGGVQYDNLKPKEARVIAAIINEKQITDWTTIQPEFNKRMRKREAHL